VQDKHYWVKGLTAQDADWLSKLPFTLCLRETLLVVHAGLVPGGSS
jgi:diadenosine tetraphosphatase ApaH/serine/threonine PP2A family protein phosphatase